MRKLIRRVNRRTEREIVRQADQIEDIEENQITG